MLASRPDLDLKAVQDHFLEVLVLVLEHLVLVLVLNFGSVYINCDRGLGLGFGLW